MSIRNKVINLKSEILFREAEDAFLYFNQPKKAIRLLNESLNLTSLHTKSLVLKGDIRFMQGKIEEALELYLLANQVNNNDSKTLASIANCLELKEDYSNALSYCDKAFLFINEDNCQLYLSLYELKLSILLKLKKYNQAKQFISTAKYRLSIEELVSLKTHNELINSKLQLQSKLKSGYIRAV